MARVKRSVAARKKRRKVLDQASGYWGTKHSSYKRAKEQVQRSLRYAYRDRRVTQARLPSPLDRPHQRGGAGERHHLRRADPRPASLAEVELDRKILAELATHEPAAFAALCARARAARELRRDPLLAARSGLRLVSSPRNPALRLAIALQTKKVRRERRLLVAEGEDLIDAALARGVRPVALPGGRRARARRRPPAGRHGRPGGALPRAGLADGQGQRPRRRPPHAGDPPPAARRGASATSRSRPSLGVYLAGVADPGNVGTLVRSAAALGADWLALGPGSADAFHPRAVRAAMGATFALPILEGVSPADLATREGFDVVARRRPRRAAALGGGPDAAAGAGPRRRAVGPRLGAGGARRRAGRS